MSAESASIRLVAGPELSLLEVRKDVAAREIPPGHPVEFKLNLGLNRLGENVLGVELSLQIANVPGLALNVAYRAVVEVADPPTDPIALNAAMKQIGGRVAPSLMYPFIRETVVSSLQRALLTAIVPPIVNFANVFDLENLAVPETRKVSG